MVMSNDEIIAELSKACKNKDWTMIDILIEKLKCESCKSLCRENLISGMREPVTIKIGNYRLLGFKNAKTGIISIPIKGTKIPMKLSNLDTYKYIRSQVKQYKLITSKIEPNGDRLGK